MSEPAAEDRSFEEEPTDRDLVLRSRSGDQAAFGTLVRRHQRRIFGLGVRLLGGVADADDLVQETFLRAWRALDRFDEDRPLAPWLVRIATNRALNVLDSRSRRTADELTETIRWEGPSPEEDAERSRLREEIMRALDQLPSDQRTILVLRAFEGLSYREISESLDVPIGTVMSRLARAREAVRKRVKR